jgi:predicted regulator of Ras-like GTPase activity (Roadblock/LC7/MglB family)
VVISESAQPLLEALNRHLPILGDWSVQAHSSVAEVIAAPDDGGPNLVIVELGAQLAEAETLLAYAKRAWPTTAFLLFTVQEGLNTAGLLERYGVMTVLHQPSVKTLCQTVEREMSGLSFGLLRGLSLPSMLQMLHWDKKSVSVLVSFQAGYQPLGPDLAESPQPVWGRLHLSDGELLDAYVHHNGATGEAAALEILSWEEVTLFLERSYHNQRRVIERPLTHLLMTAMQQKDEARMRDDFSLFNMILEDDPEDDMFFKRRSKPPAAPPEITPAALPELAPQPVAPAASVPVKTRKAAAKQPPLSHSSKAPPDSAPPDPGPAGLAPPDPAMSSTPLLVTAPLSPSTPFSPFSEVTMANVKTTLDSLLSDIDGSMAVALVDFQSGMALGTAGTGINLDVAAAGNTEVVRAKMRVMDALAIKGQIEDILITLETQYHIIYLVPNQSLFLYLVLDKSRANLAMARYKLKSIGNELKI